MTRFSHAFDLPADSMARLGVLLVNLGTPDAPTPGALRSYLREFLSDPRVVEIPRPIWWLILNGVVLWTRPKKSAQAYRSVWTEAGSPLLVNALAQRDALRAALPDIAIELGMRYGNPSIASALRALREQGVSRLLVLPLYPQYSGSTGGSTFDAVSRELQAWRQVPSWQFMASYHDHPAYIAAMAQHIKAFWQENSSGKGRPQRLLMSYHGLPQRFVDQGDPYFDECLTSSRLLAEALGLADDEYQVTFQSRFGKAEWLKPYTDQTMRALPGEGVREIDVFCPGFSADCLETLEEIAEENKGYFLEAGGAVFRYIPALNAEAVHIKALQTLIEKSLLAWRA